MMFSSTKGRWTDEELMSLPNDGRKYELIDGDLLMSPVGATHGILCVRLVTLLTNFVQRRKLGQVFDSSTGFRLSDEILLSPDVSFVSRARLAKIMVAPNKFLYGAPDLVVEVVSPSDRMPRIEAKLEKYFSHGTRLAWIVNMKLAAVAVREPSGEKLLRRTGETLTGGSVLPGFKCQLGKLFEPI